MNRSLEWPWSWEEEAEWKAELEERDNDLLEELINSAIDDGLTDSQYALELPEEEASSEESAPEKYLVTA